MKKEWDTLEVLKHARHDWLNRLQLIQGNLSLNKVDRVKEIIGEIIVEARQEAQLTNLNLPQFASELLTCNWDQHYFRLDYEVNKSSTIQHLDDKVLANWTNELFEILDASVEKFQENHLSVMIQADEEETRFFFDFSGILINTSNIIQFLEKPLNSTMTVRATAVSDEEISFEVFTIAAERV